MIEAVSTSITGLDASQSMLDASSNNLANLNTTSFKSNRVLFQDLIYVSDQIPGLREPAGTQVGRGVALSSTDKQFGQGPLINTGVSLDVAIDGAGFFQIKLPDGTTVYTRNGSFRIDTQGRLVTSDGFVVQPPITVPANFTSITIAPGGTVTVTTADQPNTPRTVGQITLVRFANPPGLTALGNNLYAASTASGQPVKSAPEQGGTGALRQGFLEGSNVDATTELANLLVAQQYFASNSQAVIVENEMLQTTVALIA
jgi:flagellar basal-body rod protein FlgG